MAQEYVPVFWDWIEVTGELNDQEKGRLIDAMVMYSRGGDWQDRIKGNERYLFPAFQQQINRARKLSDKRSDAGAIGGKQNQANESKPKQTQADASKPKQTQANRSKTPEEEEEEEAATGFGGFMDSDEAYRLQGELDAVLEEASKCGFSQDARTLDELNALCAEYTPPCVLDAIHIAHDRGKPNLGYLRGVLQRGVDAPRERPGADPSDPTGGLGWL